MCVVHVCSCCVHRLDLSPSLLTPEQGGSRISVLLWSALFPRRREGRSWGTPFSFPPSSPTDEIMDHGWYRGEGIFDVKDSVCLLWNLHSLPLLSISLLKCQKQHTHGTFDIRSTATPVLSWLHNLRMEDGQLPWLLWECNSYTSDPISPPLGNGQLYKYPIIRAEGEGKSRCSDSMIFNMADLPWAEPIQVNKIFELFGSPLTVNLQWPTFRKSG